MSVRSVVSRVVVVLAVGLSFALAAGCSGGSGGAKAPNLKSKPMPEGASWEGVYYSALYGWLHLREDGNLVQGKWIRPRRDKCGLLQGNRDGNVLRFDWKETEIGLVTPTATQKGKGYFVYSRPEGANVDDKIEGEIGKGQDEVGKPWDGIKQRNQKPDTDMTCGSGASDIGGGDWDSTNKEGGEPEAPATPSDTKQGAPPTI